MRYIHHINQWSFGTTDYIVAPDGRSVVRVMYDDNNLPPNAAMIVGLSVYKEERKKGRGNDILLEAEKAIKDNGREWAIIESEEEWIKEWYERHGYKEVAHQDGYYSLTKHLV